MFVNTFFTIRTRTEFRNFLCLKFNFVSSRQYTLTVYLCEFLLLWKYISVYDKDVRVFQLYDYLKWGCITTSKIHFIDIVSFKIQNDNFSWLITGFVTRLIRRVTLVEQELLILPEHMSSPPIFSGVRVTRSLIFNVCFVDHCLSFSTFSSGHCVLLWYTDYDYPFGIFKLFLQSIVDSVDIMKWTY